MTTFTHDEALMALAMADALNDEANDLLAGPFIDGWDRDGKYFDARVLMDEADDLLLSAEWALGSAE